ncbi:MAG: hypothetical protein JEY94_12340 [Melioribacteraceae bacterium]|nr:hypothetical protein [Melioribacteraceae bacterium]
MTSIIIKRFMSILTAVVFLTSITGFAQEKSTEKISGLVFFDYTHSTVDDPTVNNQFEINRAYFTYENAMSKSIKYKFQLDAGREDKTGKMDAYLKNAMVDWNTGYGNIMLGLQGMNVFSVQEKTWGHRFIEKSVMDRRGFSSSSDLAIGYKNKLGKAVNFSVLVSNGTGYKKAENDVFKKVSAQVYYGQGKLSSKDGFNVGGVFSYEPYDYDNTKINKVETEAKTVFGGFAGYANKGLRVGAEFDQYAEGGKDLTKAAISAYANYSVNEKFEVFARYDTYDPNTDEDDDGEGYLIGGLIWKPVEGLKVAPNVRVENYQGDIDSETTLKLNFEFLIK